MYCALRLSAVLLVCLVLTVTSPVRAEQGVAIRGAVVDPSGATVADTNVTVSSPARVYTENGRFGVAGVLRGEYTVQAASPALLSVPVRLPHRFDCARATHLGCRG